MNPDPATGRASDILGRRVHDDTGKLIGRVADLITEPAPDGTQQRVTAAIVVHHHWGRLLGYERREMTRPWILEHLARLILRRNAQEVPWQKLRLAADEQ
jgi:sporulation protein YlmC with PRC-barrel domain